MCSPSKAVPALARGTRWRRTTFWVGDRTRRSPRRARTTRAARRGSRRGWARRRGDVLADHLRVARCLHGLLRTLYLLARVRGVTSATPSSLPVAHSARACPCPCAQRGGARHERPERALRRSPRDAGVLGETLRRPRGAIGEQKPDTRGLVVRRREQHDDVPCRREDVAVVRGLRLGRETIHHLAESATLDPEPRAMRGVHLRASNARAASSSRATEPGHARPRTRSNANSTGLRARRDGDATADCEAVCTRRRARPAARERPLLRRDWRPSARPSAGCGAIGTESSPSSAPSARSRRGCGAPSRDRRARASASRPPSRRAPARRSRPARGDATARRSASSSRP